MSNIYPVDKNGNVSNGNKTTGFVNLTQTLDFLEIPYTTEETYNNQLERDIPISITVGWE